MTTMKATTHTFAAAIAVLFAALAVGSSPAASAHTPGSEFKARFTYDPKAPPQRIYQSLQQQALKQCKTPSVRSWIILRHEQACADRLLDAVVARLARTDVTGLHRQAQPLEVAGN